MPHQFTLSAFADEIDADLAAQIDLLAELDIDHVEFRSAWGKNVLDLSADELKRAREMLDARGMRVACIGSPIGKSSLEKPPEYEQSRLDKARAAAEAFGTDRVRVFSFFVPAGEAAAHRDEVLRRMRALAQQAAGYGLTLLHENEKGIYGDTGERCRDILENVDAPNLRAAFDPANFVQCNVRPMEQAWPLIQEFVTYIHVKDAVFGDGGVRPAGEGDGDLPGLLSELVRREYQGILALEPHLAHAGPSGGYSGPEGMRMATAALRKLL